MEIYLSSEELPLISFNKKEVILKAKSVVLDGMEIDVPGEYEKSEIGLHVAEFQEKPVFQLRIEGTNIAFIPDETLEINEAVTEFLGNIDILIIPGTKASQKLYENLETSVVVPYGPMRGQFLNALGQAVDPIKKYKPKESDFINETTLFINLVTE
jgi:hypothetical protein